MVRRETSRRHRAPEEALKPLEASLNQPATKLGKELVATSTSISPAKRD